MGILKLLQSVGSVFAMACLAAAAFVLANQYGVLSDVLPRTPSAEAATATPITATPPAPSAAAASVALPTAVVDRSGPPLQCAIYARQRTGISLTGAAREWWPGALGRYQRGHTPSVGSVIFMGGTEAGHVAVVTRVISPTQIVVDHANWLGQGEIITGALVDDASANHDWSEVTVWNVSTHSMGLRRYPVFGFVGPKPI